MINVALPIEFPNNQVNSRFANFQKGVNTVSNKNSNGELEEFADMIKEQFDLENNSFFSEVSNDAICSIYAPGLVFKRELLKKIDSISDADISKGNSTFDNLCVHPVVKKWINMMLETCLGFLQGRTISYEYIEAGNPEDKIAYEFTKKLSVILTGSENGYIVFKSNNNPYAFVSNQTILSVFVSGEAFDWSGYLRNNRLNDVEKNIVYYFMDQILNREKTSGHFRKMINIILEYTESSKVTGPSILDFDSKGNTGQEYGIGNISGILTKIKVPFTLSSNDLLPILYGTEAENCYYSVVGNRENVGEGMLAHCSKLCVEKTDERKRRIKIDFIRPFANSVLDKMEEEGLTIIDEKATGLESGCIKVEYKIIHNQTKIKFAVTKIYDKKSQEIIRNIPVIIQEHRATGAIKKEVQAYYYTYNRNSDEIESIKIGNSDAKTTDWVSTATGNVVEGGENWIEDFSITEFAKRPEYLSLIRICGENQQEIGCLVLNDLFNTAVSKTNAKIGIDMGTSTTSVAVKMGDGNPELIDIIDQKVYSCITGIPEEEAAAISEKFIYFCIGATDGANKKIRTCIHKYQKQETKGVQNINGSNVHENGHLLPYSTSLQNVLSHILGENRKNLIDYNIITDIKFGRNNDISNRTIFLREVLYTALAYVITRGATSVEINAAYPKNSIRQSIEEAWRNVKAAALKWPMVKKNNVNINDVKLWTEASAVTNYIFNTSTTPPDAEAGYTLLDIGDATSDANSFSLEGQQSKLQQQNEMSLMYAGDDIIVDTIVWSLHQDRNNELYKKWFGNDGSNIGHLIFKVEENTSQSEVLDELLKKINDNDRTYFYNPRYNSQDEDIRNSVLSLLEESGINENLLPTSVKALLIMKYGALFYTLGKYLKNSVNTDWIKKANYTSYHIKLIGGGSKILRVLSNGVGFNNSDIGLFLRALISAELDIEMSKISCEFLQADSQLKEELAKGMVYPLSECLNPRPSEQDEGNERSWSTEFFNVDATENPTEENMNSSESLKHENVFKKVQTQYVNRLRQANEMRIENGGDRWNDEFGLVFNIDGFLHTIQAENARSLDISKNDKKEIIAKLINFEDMRCKAYDADIPVDVRNPYSVARITENYLKKICSL